VLHAVGERVADDADVLAGTEFEQAGGFRRLAENRQKGQTCDAGDESNDE
jgi:hypothetical protein